MAFIARTDSERARRIKQHSNLPGPCWIERPVPNPPQRVLTDLRTFGRPDSSDDDCDACHGWAVDGLRGVRMPLQGNENIPYDSGDAAHPQYKFWERSRCETPQAIQAVPTPTHAPVAQPLPSQPKPAAKDDSQTRGKLSARQYRGGADPSGFVVGKSVDTTWTFSDGRLMHDDGTCLAGPANARHPEMRPCDTDDPLQRWRVDAKDKTVCSVSSGACLYASATRSMHTQPPAFNPPLRFEEEEETEQPQAQQQRSVESDDGGRQAVASTPNPSSAVYEHQPFLNMFAPMSRRRKLI